MINATNTDYGESRPVSHEQMNWIESLIETSTLDPEQRTSFTRGLKDLDQSTVDEVITFLCNNQQDAITQRTSASASEINKKLRKICKP